MTLKRQRKWKNTKQILSISNFFGRIANRGRRTRPRAPKSTPRARKAPNRPLRDGNDASTADRHLAGWWAASRRISIRAGTGVSRQPTRSRHLRRDDHLIGLNFLGRVRQDLSLSGHVGETISSRTRTSLAWEWCEEIKVVGRWCNFLCVCEDWSLDVLWVLCLNFLSDFHEWKFLWWTVWDFVLGSLPIVFLSLLSSWSST